MLKIVSFVSAAMPDVTVCIQMKQSVTSNMFYIDVYGYIMCKIV